jgi:hypothetical protein
MHVNLKLKSAVPFVSISITKLHMRIYAAIDIPSPGYYLVPKLQTYYAAMGAIYYGPNVCKRPDLQILRNELFAMRTLRYARVD